MSTIIPLLLLTDDNEKNDKTGLLLTLLTQDQNMLQNPSSIMPFVFLKNKMTDLPTLYLILSSMRNQCMSQAQMTNAFLTYVLLDNTIENKNEGTDTILRQTVF